MYVYKSTFFLDPNLGKLKESHSKNKARVCAELQAYSLISGYCTFQHKNFIRSFKVIYVCLSHTHPKTVEYLWSTEP